MTEPLQWVLFTCAVRTGKLVSGQYIVKDGVLFVRDPCGAAAAEPLRENLSVFDLACRMLRELYGGL
jgi:hypothetical protein